MSHDFTDRYQALGIAYPDPEAMCKGECDGTGVYPVKNPFVASGIHHDDDLPSEAELNTWQRIHDAAGNHECDGWHFLLCPTCGGTGKASSSASAVTQA